MEVNTYVGAQQRAAAQVVRWSGDAMTSNESMVSKSRRGFESARVEGQQRGVAQVVRHHNAGVQ